MAAEYLKFEIYLLFWYLGFEILTSIIESTR